MYEFKQRFIIVALRNEKGSYSRLVMRLFGR